MTLTGHTDEVNAVIYSPDGNTIATGGKDKTVQLWDAMTGQHRTTLKTEMRWYVDCLAFSPNGTTLACGNGWETIHLWDIATGKLKATLDGETDSIYAIAYSPDGNTLATASGYDTVHLWDVDLGQIKGRLVGHKNDVNSIAYSPDGNTFASVSLDGTIILWDTAPSTTTLSLVPVPVEHDAVGERLTFSINIANGESVAGYQVTVLYDNSALRYIESSNGVFLTGHQTDGVFVIPPNVSDKGVILAAATLSGEKSGDGTLATITFEVIGAITSTPTISNGLLAQGTGNSIVPQIETGLKTESQENALELQEN